MTATAAPRRKTKKAPSGTTPWTPPPIPERPTVAAFAAGIKFDSCEMRTATLSAVAQLVQTAWDAIRCGQYMHPAIYPGDLDARIVKSRDMAAAEQVQLLLKMALTVMHEVGFHGVGFDTHTAGEALRDAATVADRLNCLAYWTEDGDEDAHLFPHLAADKKAKRRAATEAKGKEPKALTTASKRFDFAALPPAVECGC